MNEEAKRNQDRALAATQSATIAARAVAGNGKAAELAQAPSQRPDDLLSQHNRHMLLLGKLADGFGSLGQKDKERVQNFILRHDAEFKTFLTDLIADKRRDLTDIERYLGVSP